MDIRKIKKLIELLNESGIGEIEIREGEESVRISRQGTFLPVSQMPYVPMEAVSHIPSLPKAIPTPPVAPGEAGIAKPVSAPPEGYTVKSPMVGTVYLAPAAGSEPFVKLGQRVEATTVICIVEAMKMFNQIEAGKAGVISARLIENEQPVEYDQPLFIIEEE